VPPTSPPPHYTTPAYFSSVDLPPISHVNTGGCLWKGKLPFCSGQCEPGYELVRTASSGNELTEHDGRQFGVMGCATGGSML
jgi:hypothetical protein